MRGRQIAIDELTPTGAGARRRNAVVDRSGGPQLGLMVFAHDVRSPLSVASGVVSTLQRDDSGLKEAQRVRLLEALGNSLARVERLVDEVLDLDRLQSDGVELAAGEVDLTDACRRAIEDCGDPGRVALAGGHTVLSGDPVLVKRAVVNLVDNALRHSEGRVRVDVSHSGQGGLLVIDDDGDGVAPNLRERVFEPFVRGERSVGVGLGLALVRRIAELHGGQVWVEERPGGGARFAMWLPR